MTEPTYFGIHLASAANAQRQPASAAIAIVGGGPAGMALALALKRQGIDAVIHDARPRGAVRQDKRTLALSHGSRQILEWLGVWPKIAATPIERIHVSQQGAFGRTLITAAEQGVPALGHVCSAASLGGALDDALTAAGITVHDNDLVRHVDIVGDAAQIQAASGTHATRLVVYAEGAIDAAATSGPAAVQRDYGQHAVICNVTPTVPHRHVAWERFTAQGPLALLPCGSELAVVYTGAPEQAAALAALPDDAFLTRLQAHFGRRLVFSAATPRHVFPLGLRYRRHPVGPRCVWLGNAAQTLHPVAGQGFNLALRDVYDLARTLADARDPGDPAVLARYAAARRLDRRSTIGFTDSLVRLFSNDWPLLREGRGLALCALDLLPPLRGFVARRMMFGARAWP